MDHSYEQIMNLPDSYEIKSVVRRWNTLSERLEKNPAKGPILLPELFLTAKYGVGKTHVLRLLSEYLSSKSNLMEFYGDVKFFEFFVNYRKPEQDFDEIRRLMATIASTAGFRSEYKGIVCLDVNEWVRHCEEKHFISLLEYLSVNSDYWLIVFSVSDGTEQELMNMEAVLSMFFRIEKVNLRLPDTTDLLSYIQRKLADYHIKMNTDASELLRKTIDTLSNNKYFDGYKTLDMLVRDILYSVYTSDCPRQLLSPEDIAGFSEDSEYIRRRLLHYGTKSRMIGFTGGGEK